MNKTEIKDKRTELVRTLIEIEKLKVQKTAIEKTLAEDFEAHELDYRNGIKTDAGLLVRRPNWKTIAKPVVEVA